MHYRISNRVRSDLFDIHDYIAQDNAKAADRFVELFFEKFELLSEMPNIGTRMDELSPGLRAFSFRK